MHNIGLNTYHFSVSWPRVLPTGRQQVNTKGLDFYDRLVDELLKYDIQPALTLYHWDLPEALQQRGGWKVRETAYAFAEYSDLLSRQLDDLE